MPYTLDTVEAYYRARRRDNRLAVSNYADLIAAPQPLPLTVPDAAEFAVMFPAGTPGGIVITTNTGRSIGVPALASGRFYRIGYFEPGIVLSAGPAMAGGGLYIANGLGYTLVATA
jgi:hypothetical protein